MSYFYMENFIIVILGFILAVAAGQWIIPGILIISLRKRLFDIPDKRKVHNRPVPRLGGVSFFPIILFVMSSMTILRLLMKSLSNVFFTVEVVNEMLSLVAGLTLLYLIGIADDLIGVRYRQKFVIQIISAAFLPIVGLYLEGFDGLLGIYGFSPFIGVPLTMLLVVFITNAINLIDGIDGLASGLSIVTFSILGIAFALNNLWMYSLLAFSCVGMLIPFFWYNVFGNADRGRKIFMGDTGSLTLGYVLSFLIIKFFIHSNICVGEMSGSSLVVAFSMLLVPCLDVCRVVLGRIHRHLNPFKPDRTHIHHKFLEMGFSPRRSMVYIQLMSVSFILFTILLFYWRVDATVVLGLDILIWIGLNMWYSRIIKQKIQKKTVVFVNKE